MTVEGKRLHGSLSLLFSSICDVNTNHQLYDYVCSLCVTACALQFLNERNISHLDLKPQNILLSGSVLKLAGDVILTQTVK